MPSWRAALQRRREGKDKGRRLVRQLDDMENFSSEQMVALSNAFSELLEEYPDLYPDAPIAVESMRKHTASLLQASEVMRRTEAQVRDAQRNLREAAKNGLAAVEEAKRVATPEERATIRDIELQVRRYAAK